MASWSEKKYPEPDKKDSWKVKDFFRAKYVEKRFEKQNKIDSDSEDSEEERSKRRKERRRKRRQQAKEESSDDEPVEEKKAPVEDSDSGEDFPAA